MKLFSVSSFLKFIGVSTLILILYLSVGAMSSFNSITHPSYDYGAEATVSKAPVPRIFPQTPDNVTDIDAIIAAMSTRDKIAQLMVVWAYGQYQSDDSDRYERIHNLVAKENVGGLMFSRGGIYDQALLTNRLQREAKIPLWITQDMEFGAAMRIEGSTRIVPAMGVAATGNSLNAWHKGRITALEAKSVGVHQVFAPVVDINNNASNPVINTRSFSEDPLVVARYADAFIQGVQSVGVMATAKHFPGHGDTNVDSHYALPVISHNWNRINSVELVPFRAVIGSKVGSIMSAHIAFPELAEERRRPGTLSKNVLTGILRDSLGFTGLIVTDALEMRGISNQYTPGEAVIMAIQAGADILLAPLDVPRALDEAVAAVANGTLDIKQVETALYRFLKLKREFGLFEQPPVDIEAIASIMNNREFRAIANQIARESITLVKNPRQLIPLKTESNPRIHIVSVTNNQNDQTAQALLRNMRSYHSNIGSDGLDLRSTREDVNSAVQSATRADIIILALPTSVGGRYRNNHPAIAHNLIARLQNSGKPVIAIAFGNPYIIDLASFADAHIMAWAATDNQYKVVSDALFGTARISGQLPVGIDKLYEKGHGVTVHQTLLRSDYPESVKLHSDSLNNIANILERAIDDRVFPGAAVAVVRDGVLAYNKAFGHHTYDKLVPTRPDDVFDLASVTKVMATTLATMRLIDQGKLSLDTHLAEHFDEFTEGKRAEITIRQVLTHTSGMASFRIYIDEIKSRAPLVNAILNEPLVNEPGEEYVYSDLGMITLAILVERISGKDIDTFLQNELYGPLGLENTLFNPARRGAAFVERILPTEHDTIYRNTTMKGHVHDERAYYLDGLAGHAGLFSSAPDLAVLVQLIINKGTYGGKRYFSEEIIETFTQRQPPLNRRGLGFDLKTLEGFTSAGQHSGDKTFGHLGFTGTSFWIDPETKTGVILLTNRTYPYRDQSGRISRVRAAISDVVFSSYIE